MVCVCVCEGGGAQRGGRYWWLREMVCVCVKRRGTGRQEVLVAQGDGGVCV